MMRRAWMRRVGVLAVLVALIATGLSLYLGSVLDRPLKLSQPVLITVSSGATLRPVLAEINRVVPSVAPKTTYLAARLTGHTQVSAGLYELKPGQSLRQALAMIEGGEVKLDTFTLPEGLNRWQVRGKLAEEKWMSPLAFDRLCDDRALLNAHGIEGPTCEGYLLPETYTWARGLAPTKIFADMFERFKKAYAELTSVGSGPMSLNTRELITLASIVEKETGAPEDRSHIACVFYNRLQALPPWRLDSDPTVIYAAVMKDPDFDGNLKREHLHGLDSPYNTYRVVGLPPGPIANPGRAALAAVVHPAECKDFFFVSMNNARSVFCPTIACHNQAVKKWQVDYFHHSH
jgi:UPF0755 protein